MNEKPTPIELNGTKYYSIDDFATLVGRCYHTIYRMIMWGNSIRKLKHKRFFGRRIFIPATELTEYPFTPTGANSATKAYHYDEKLEETTA
jgi:hypothetical protein